MSKIVVFGTDRKAAGEFVANVDRGWMLTGHPSVAGGGNTELQLTADVASKSFLDFGRMVLAPHEKLPPWAGMLDTPWNASQLKVTCYNAEYLLSLRSPEQPVILEGPIGSIVEQMLELFNAGQDLFVRLGDTSRADQTTRRESLDGRTYWEQLKAFLQRAGCEMQTRAERDADGHLVIYLDLAQQIGIDTGFLYVDGRDGNAVFREVVMDGVIRNHVVGQSDEAGPTSRLRTDPMFNEESIELYGMRSESVQFRDIREQVALDLYTRNYLNYKAFPHISFLMDVIDKGDAFLNCRLGNIARVRISQAYLPGGVQGWQGSARILAMAYTESGSGLLTAMCEAI